MFNFQLFDDTGSTKRRFTGGREREQICRQVKVLSSQQRNNTNELKPVKERNILTQCENPKNCPERDLNPRPRLSGADVLTTTPSGRSRDNAAAALWLTGLPNKF